MPTPSYINLHKSGLLRERVDQAYEILSSCGICPRHCGINRLEGEIGFCRTGLEAVISSYGPHFGEEPPLVGIHGSGTIFFTHCNLACVYCQNYSISHLDEGRQVSCEELAEIMLGLQDAGCHNINLVSPTHIVPQILGALEIAASRGLRIPLVYNTGTYDSAEMLALLDRVIDIYMPDAKYGRDDVALGLSGIPEYTRMMRSALWEMYRQVGDLVCDHGVATRGLLIRHLVLPHNLASSEIVMEWIANEISTESYVNIMAQYNPNMLIQYHRNVETPFLKQLQRRITQEEYDYAIRCAREAGLQRGF